MTVDSIIRYMSGTAWDVAYDCGLHEGMCDTIAATIASSEKAYRQAGNIAANGDSWWQHQAFLRSLRQVVKDVRTAHAGYMAKQGR